MNKMHFKVGLLAAGSLLLAGLFLIYLLHARGFFEGTYHLQLAAASADGVAPGVPVVFSGIEIGSVTSLGLNDGGGIIIHASFRERNARWLKENSIFTLDKPIVGGAKIRVESPDLNAPDLPDNSTMLLVSSDITKELPVLVERVKAILANVEHLTRKDGEVEATLANVETVTRRMTGEYGMLEGLLGSAEKARAVTDALDGTRDLIARLDGITAKTDRWLYAQEGVADQVRQMLTDAQASLAKADALMANAVDISADVKEGTQDIAALRAEIDDAVRKANDLVSEINRKWPFAREPEVKLP
ncbi:MAG TPA: MlaD family protein [Thiobacillaceae bacterium]|nr:MlaD family protein [Thiobacillaceae bacterium]